MELLIGLGVELVLRLAVGLAALLPSNVDAQSTTVPPAVTVVVAALDPAPLQPNELW